jgi:hypothetical protein
MFMSQLSDSSAHARMRGHNQPKKYLPIQAICMHDSPVGLDDHRALISQLVGSIDIIAEIWKHRDTLVYFNLDET